MGADSPSLFNPFPPGELVLVPVLIPSKNALKASLNKPIVVVVIVVVVVYCFGFVFCCCCFVVVVVVFGLVFGCCFLLLPLTF